MKLKKCLAAILSVAIIGGCFSDLVQAADLKINVRSEKSTEEETTAVDDGQVYMEFPEDGSEVVVEEYVDANRARVAPYYNIRTNGGTWDGTYYKRNGTIMKNCFFCDGTYTYYLEANGKPMKNKLTYHPDGDHLIYFDDKGHEVFDNFQYCADVGYTCYFDTFGYMYKNQITFKYGSAYYLDGNGERQQDGWFQFANGVDYGYASSGGRLKTDGFNYDPWGRVVYYHWNGMVARGLITDGNNYYNFDLSDGHYLGSFPANNPNPVYGAGKYIVGVNIPATEIIITGNPTNVWDASFGLYDSAGTGIYYDYNSSQIVSLQKGQILIINSGTATTNIGSRYVDISTGCFNAKIGVHLPAGVYRVQYSNVENKKYVPYVRVWNSRTGYDRDLAYERIMEELASGYVDVRVSNGQVLDVWDCNVTYLGQ